MIKLAIGFLAFAALAIAVLLSLGGGDLDLTGEKHGGAAPALAPEPARHAQA